MHHLNASSPEKLRPVKLWFPLVSVWVGLRLNKAQGSWDYWTRCWDAKGRLQGGKKSEGFILPVGLLSDNAAQQQLSHTPTPTSLYIPNTCLTCIPMDSRAPEGTLEYQLPRPPQSSWDKRWGQIFKILSPHQLHGTYLTHWSRFPVPDLVVELLHVVINCVAFLTVFLAF